MASQCGVTRLTVGKIWHRVVQQMKDGQICAAVTARRKGICGRKKKDYIAELASIPDVPLNCRGTIRGLASAVHVPKSTLHDKLKAKEIKRVTSVVRPLLTSANKLARLQFCLSKVKDDGYFHDFMDTVHIDEKWFYLQITKCSY